jgi:hypothetical protein
MPIRISAMMDQGSDRRDFGYRDSWSPFTWIDRVLCGQGIEVPQFMRDQSNHC